MENEQRKEPLDSIIIQDLTQQSISAPIETEISDIAEIVQDETFTYNGYQVVRREFFAHVHEPSISFNKYKVTFNTACLRKLPHVNYVQMLVNPNEKKLVVRPCSEDEKDSIAWCSHPNGKRKPKQITCRLFFSKITSLMDWNGDYRYKILGKIIRSSNELLILFDLTAAETYVRVIQEDKKSHTSRTPIFPAEWQTQFGLPVEEHQKLLQVNIFDGYTVFHVQEPKTKSLPIESKI